RSRADRVLAPAPRALQVPDLGRVPRRAAAHRDRQAAEVPAAREILEGPEEGELKYLAFALLLVLSVGARAADIGPGDKAPDFTWQPADGKAVKLADFVGKRGFVLAWFPKAFTSGCTEELKSFGDADAQAALAKYDVSVYMVSFDAPDKNAEFAKSLGAKL